MNTDDDTQPDTAVNTEDLLRRQFREALRQADEAAEDALQAAKALHAQREQNQALRSWASQTKALLYRYTREQRALADSLNTLAMQGERLLLDGRAPDDGADVDALQQRIAKLEWQLKQSANAQRLAQRQHADLVAAVALWGARLADAQGSKDWRAMLAPEVQSALNGCEVVDQTSVLVVVREGQDS